MGFCCRWAFTTPGLIVLSGTGAMPRFHSAWSSLGLETFIYNRTHIGFFFFAHHHRKITFRSWKELKHIYVVCLCSYTRVRTEFLSQAKTTDFLIWCARIRYIWFFFPVFCLFWSSLVQYARIWNSLSPRIFNCMHYFSQTLVCFPNYPTLWKCCWM